MTATLRQPDAAIDDATWAAVVRSGHVLLAEKARTFRLATAMLPAGLHDDIAVLYAFCRTADDLVDEARDEAALRLLEREIAGFAEPRPLVRALRDIARRRGVSLCHAQALLEGVRNDLGHVEIENDSELLAYSWQVASTVGLMMSRVLGVDDPAAEAHAADLGLAMQLTNIVRDVREDALLGRVYLPRTRLAAHGLTADDVLEGRGREGVRLVCLELLDLADQYYASGEAGLRYIPLRARVGVAVAQRVYASIGWRIRATGHHPLDGRLVVPRSEKLGRVGQAVAVSVRTSFSRLPESHRASPA
jgi:phytoene synthase